MTDDIFPLGGYSRNDVISSLNNSIQTKQQNVNSSVPATWTKDYYGWNFFSGSIASSAGTLNMWVPFERQIPNIVNVDTQFLGLGASSSPTGIYNTSMAPSTAQPAVVMAVAGISDSGFSARMCSAQNGPSDTGTFFFSSAYVFSWHVVAKVR